LANEIDLGSGYSAYWIGWHPDRSIPANNERYKDIPDIPHAVLMVECPHGKAGLRVDRPEIRKVFPDGPFWTIESEVPLTLSPSILRTNCGCHGFIRQGKWVPA
jgi:hypothetical protein